MQIKRSFTWQSHWALIWKIAFEARRHLYHLSGLITYFLSNCCVLINRFPLHTPHTHCCITYSSVLFESTTLLSVIDEFEVENMLELGELQYISALSDLFCTTLPQRNSVAFIKKKTLFVKAFMQIPPSSIHSSFLYFMKPLNNSRVFKIPGRLSTPAVAAFQLRLITDKQHSHYLEEKNCWKL